MGDVINIFRIYDVLGRVTSVTDVYGKTVGYSYDEYGRISKITYPDDRTVSYTYDLADNLLKVEDSAGETVEYTYDAMGNVLTCSRSSGIVTEYSYDALGQVTSVINKDDELILSSFAYTYDANGQIMTEHAVQGEEQSDKTCTYDEDGQLVAYTEERNGETYETQYVYSETGNRIAITKGDGISRTESEYNENGQLISETIDGVTTEYTYDENGNLIEKNDGSVTTTYAYYIENRLTAVREGGAVLMAATYDGDGNRTFQLTRQTRTVEITEDSFLDGLFSSNVYGSPTNTVASIPEIFGVSQEEVYTYLEQIFVDPADTIFWYGVIQGFIEFFVGANTFLTAICTDWFNGEWTAVTDAYELELHSDVVYSDTDMETLQNAGLSEEEIAYITTGKSSSREDIVIPSKTSSNVQATYDLTYYVNDVNTANTQVLMTYGASESQEASYIYGLERIAEVEPVDVDVNTGSGEGQDNADVLSAGAEYYLYDGRGSVVQTMTGNEITLSLIYDPFGEIISGADENFIGYAYNGEETNNVTGLQYLRARYYDAELGSFITIDSYLGSLTDTISQNRYTYANNDPVNNIDPSGHYSQNVNGTNKYYQSTGLNELRDYMTAAALWAGEVTAQSGYNSAVSRAQNTAFTNYQNISGISQSTANSYIAQGIAQAEQVSMNYGCSEPAVPNEAVAKFTNNVNAGRVSANAQIEGIKESKKTKYDNLASVVDIILNSIKNVGERLETFLMYNADTEDWIRRAVEDEKAIEININGATYYEFLDNFYYENYGDVYDGHPVYLKVEDEYKMFIVRDEKKGISVPLGIFEEDPIKYLYSNGWNEPLEHYNYHTEGISNDLKSEAKQVAEYYATGGNASSFGTNILNYLGYKETGGVKISFTQEELDQIAGRWSGSSDMDNFNGEIEAHAELLIENTTLSGVICATFIISGRKDSESYNRSLAIADLAAGDAGLDKKIMDIYWGNKHKLLR